MNPLVPWRLIHAAATNSHEARTMTGIAKHPLSRVPFTDDTIIRIHPWHGYNRSAVTPNFTAGHDV